MPVGVCKLCLLPKELRESHYLPRGMYRLLREKSLSNPNPMLLSKRGVVQASHQVTDYVLCGNCERLFDRNGENWVVARMARLGCFPLWEMVGKTYPVIVEGDTAGYAGIMVPGLDMDRLVYFGMSVFWRGAAHQWHNQRGPLNRIDLGAHEEPIRKYLHGEAPFPDDAVLVISISPTRNAMLGAFPPCPAEDRQYPIFLFFVPGIQFVLATGPDAMKAMGKECAYCSPQRFIFASAAVERNVRRSFRSQLDRDNVAGIRKTLQEIAKKRRRTP